MQNTTWPLFKEIQIKSKIIMQSNLFPKDWVATLRGVARDLEYTDRGCCCVSPPDATVGHGLCSSYVKESAPCTAEYEHDSQ